jgi:hypothetical protein
MRMKRVNGVKSRPVFDHVIVVEGLEKAVAYLN